MSKYKEHDVVEFDVDFFGESIAISGTIVHIYAFDYDIEVYEVEFTIQDKIYVRTITAEDLN